uniref:ADP-ribosylation factor-like 10 n=1 Tax=Nothobranchius furzeri TaxID=105023 RepID=A0A8C6PIX0_NOTFU
MGRSRVGCGALVFFMLLWSVFGGGEDLRRYWLDYLRRTHILVYVVDSSDRSRLPLAKAELHRLLSVEPQLPVVVLGNKQDKANAVSVSELHDALSLDAVADDRKLFLLAAQLDSEENAVFLDGIKQKNY